MEPKICTCCGQPFHPRPQVPDQTFCSKAACQRERRKTWQRQKLQEDPLYRENQQDAQRAWRDRNPDYSRKYRSLNPVYVTKNRQQQRSKPSAGHALNSAEKDVSMWPAGLPAGLYKIRHIQPTGNAKMDVWIVELSPVCDDCPCKTDACKDRT